MQAAAIKNNPRPPLVMVRGAMAVLNQPGNASNADRDLVRRWLEEAIEAMESITSADFDRSFTFTGRELRGLMRSHAVTIKGLASRTGITMQRIRQLREKGVRGYSAIDLYEAITGTLSDRMRAALRQRVVSTEYNSEIPSAIA